MVRRLAFVALIAIVTAGLNGCSGGGNKGKNKDLDRPTATNK